MHILMDYERARVGYEFISVMFSQECPSGECSGDLSGGGCSGQMSRGEIDKVK